MKLSAAPCSVASDASQTTGRLFNIQRFSLHDGPGIRSVVFLKGCPLQCVWCANPEGISPRQDVFAGRCPQSAPRHIGEVRTVADVHAQVMADEAYYRTSGGGVTLSGGEMAMQPLFARELLAACRLDGVHTAVETSGFAPWSALWQACEFSQLILFDLKLADQQRHVRYTGVGNQLILLNLKRLLTGSIPIRLRIPVIPGVNDDPPQAEKMMSMIRALTAGHSAFTGIDLLPYHSFGVGKYALLGKPYRYAEMHPDAGNANTATLANAAQRHGLPTATLSHCIA
ncbi:glycyl-radical enzyme activating protein [Brenneria tiliae]|uniref:glycyl-radical enzyme activating protein n=1 Tax=Brenneria tiliae TaxID=2914984 RepID=UPI00201492EC|nr:glycyl-radical enzyme activating protein [Brenneria tiliae]MCL2897915.1 glycyl-radical enzyme activating protein [Brenneria tiliae]MCL2901996.1 glycyl-radical enzyme activating protein [Brenneria tiliae]